MKRLSLFLENKFLIKKNIDKTDKDDVDHTQTMITIVKELCNILDINLDKNNFNHSSEYYYNVLIGPEIVIKHEKEILNLFNDIQKENKVIAKKFNSWQYIIQNYESAKGHADTYYWINLWFNGVTGNKQNKLYKIVISTTLYNVIFKS